MRTLILIVVIFLAPCVICGVQPPPAWHTIKGTVESLANHGFEFSVDDSMWHHYEKPTVEISILIPERFMDSGFTNTFSSVLFLSDEISTSLGTHEREGKKRVILTISETMAGKSQVIVYFRNDRKGVTHGSMYRLELTKILEHWRKQKP